MKPLAFWSNGPGTKPRRRSFKDAVRNVLLAQGLLAGVAAGQVTPITNPSAFSTGHRLIDFESLPVSPLVPITNQFLNQGVLISTDVGSAAQSINDSTVTSPRQFPPQGQRALSNPGLNNVILTFNQRITRVGFEIRTNTNDDLNVTLRCLCVGGFQHTQFFVTNLTYRFVGLESTVPIKEVVIDVTQNVNGSMRVDNLRFEGPPQCDVSSAVYESAQYDPCPPDPQFPTLELCQGGASISGPPNGPTQYIGSRFHVRETFEVSTVGGQIQGPRPQLGLGDQHIFAVIVSLSGPAAFPVGGGAGFPFSATEIVGSTRFHPGLGGNDVRTPLSATLTPGDYALIFGAGDVPGFSTFDTTGDASMPVSSLASVSTIIQWDGFSWIDNFYGPGFGPRFVVEGRTLFKEGAGTTTGVTLNGSRSRDVEGFSVNYQWSTDCPGGSIDTPTAATASLSLDSTATCPSGVTCSVTLVVDDGNDSSAANPSDTCAWTVSIDDTTKPAVTCPADAPGLECPADTSAGARGTATASDLYGVATVASSDDTMPGCGTTESIVRTWTATDNCNNAASCDQLISTVDTTAPTITCPANATALACNADTSVTARGTATAEDDCGGTTVASVDSTVPGCGITQSITRTWTATDDCGNPATCNQAIATVDTTPPIINVNTTPISVNDADCSGSESVTVPTATANDGCDGPRPVTNNAPSAFPAGQTTTVTYSSSDACTNTATATVNVTVRFGAHIHVKAQKFVVGLGHHPSVSKQPLANILVGAYDNSTGSCARNELNGNWGLLFLALPDIIANCTPVATGVTAADGTVLLDVPPGDYVVATHFDSDGDNDLDQYLGDKVHSLVCGETDTSRLFMIQIVTGKKHGCHWHRLTGSELIIVEPEDVVWDGTEQLYPFVFESVGDWGVTATVEPPDGFVADYEQLSTDVDNELEAVQFTVTEVGSDLVPTKTEFRVVHKGRTRTVRSEVGIRLTPEYAKSRGFEVAELKEKGLIVEPPAKPQRRNQP